MAGLVLHDFGFRAEVLPKAIIDYANTRGSEKVMYAGYYPAGLDLERIFAELPEVPLRPHVWPKFLHEKCREGLQDPGAC